MRPVRSAKSGPPRRTGTSRPRPEYDARTTAQRRQLQRGDHDKFTVSTPETTMASWERDRAAAGTENSLVTSRYPRLGSQREGPRSSKPQLLWIPRLRKARGTYLAATIIKAPFVVSKDGEQRHDLHTMIGRRPSWPETNSMAGRVCVHTEGHSLHNCHHSSMSVHEEEKKSTRSKWPECRRIRDMPDAYSSYAYPSHGTCNFFAELSNVIELQACHRVFAPSRRDQDRKHIPVLPRLFALLQWPLPPQWEVLDGPQSLQFF